MKLSNDAQQRIQKGAFMKPKTTIKLELLDTERRNCRKSKIKIADILAFYLANNRFCANQESIIVT